MELTPYQKEEIRRLTQLANRRIKAVNKAYEKEGLSVLPVELVGKFQVKEKWATDSTPISRSTKFESIQAYNQHLRMLRSFERERDHLTGYTQVQREKLLLSMATSFGEDLDPKMEAKLSKMTAPQLAKFWKQYKDVAVKMIDNFSSQAAMVETLSQLYPEDRKTIQERMYGKKE